MPCMETVRYSLYRLCVHSSPGKPGRPMPENNSLDLSTSPLTIETANWRTVAKKAAQETDPDKLLQLVHDLCRILDGARVTP